jgi:Tol biopolymer transport system component
VAAAAVVLTFMARPAAQERRMLTLVSLAEIPRIADPQLFLDGRFVSYALARADWQANRQVTHIWRQATSGGSAAQVTSGDGSEMLARWSPDSASIAFLARASDGLQIFLVGGDGSARRQLTHHASGVYGGAPPVWSPDGEELYFLASDPPGALERDQHRLRDDLAEYQSNVKPRHLWRIAVATGAEQRIAEGSFSVLSFRLSRNGTRLVEHRAPTTLVDDGARSEIWVSDATGGSAHRVTENGVEEVEAELSPDIRRSCSSPTPTRSSNRFTTLALHRPGIRRHAA